MPDLYTLCYPRLRDEDRRFIDALRREHDCAFCDVVAPHFTLAFAIADVPEAAYRGHVAAIARTQPAIAFRIRSAMPVSDAAANTCHAYLVPEEGHADISRLHDRLYSGLLAPHLRLDIPYVPHMSVARNPDPARIKSLCDEINANGIDIRGSLPALAVCAYDGAKITDLAAFSCAG